MTVIVVASNRVSPEVKKAIDEFEAKEKRLHDPAYLKTPEGKRELLREKRRQKKFACQTARIQEAFSRPLDPRIANESVYVRDC